MKKINKILTFLIAAVFFIVLQETSYAANFADDLSSWSPINASGPSERRGHSAVYDSGNTMIVFGGIGGGNYKNDVWKLNLSSNTWTLINAAADPDRTKDPDGYPNPRATHSAVWTGADMIIFGGWNHLIDGAVYRDVWILKNALGPSPQWERKDVAPIGYGVRGSSAVWTGSKMVIFGGMADDSRVFNRVMTYEPSSNNWTSNFAGAIDARYEHSAIYDSGSDAMYVFGGRGSGHMVRNDVWKLSNASTTNSSVSWSRSIDNNTISPPAGPLRRAGHSAFFDSGNNQMLIFGGITSGGNLSNDAWALKMSDLSWTKISPSGALPGTRSDQAGVYDGVDEVVIFGGNKQGLGDYGDTWKLNFTPRVIPPPTDPPTVMDVKPVCTWSNISSVILYWTDHAGSPDEYRYYYTKDGESEIGPISISGASLDSRGLRYKTLTTTDFNEGGMYTFRIGHTIDSHIGPLTNSIQLPMCVPSLKIVPKDGEPVVEIGDDTYTAHAGVDPLKFLAFRDVDGSDTSFEEYDTTVESFTSWYEQNDPLDIIQIGNDWGGSSACTDAAPMIFFEKSCVRNNFPPHTNGMKGLSQIEARWVSSMTLSDIATLEFTNQNPIIDPPLLDRAVNTGQSVNLDDATVSDPDGDTMTYAWSCTQGTISPSTALHPTYTASLLSGTPTCTLTVSDGRGGTASDELVVTVTAPPVNQPPVADADVTTDNNNPPAGTDSTSVTINETSGGVTPSVFVWGDDSTDPEGLGLTYGWNCGAEGVVGDSTPDSGNTTFDPPNDITSNQTYTCTLTVTDSGSLTHTDSVTINVNNYVPGNTGPTAVLDIENNSETTITAAIVNETVYLDVRDSTDSDDGIKEVRFCSDDSFGDGTCTGASWTEWYNWTSNSSDGTWKSGPKEKQWSFATSGSKGVYAEVRDFAGASDIDEKEIVVSPTAVTLTTSAGCDGDNDAKVDLSWTGGLGATGFDVYRKTGAGSYSKINTTLLTSSTFSYLDSAVAISTTYTYKVTAVGGDNTDSNASSVTTGACVGNSLGVTLSTSATPPFQGSVDTSLTAAVTGTGSGASGLIDYFFWWDCANASQDYDDVVDDCGMPNSANMGRPETTFSSSSHTYITGSYTGKVVVKRSGLSAQDQEVIVVAASPCSPDNDPPNPFALSSPADGSSGHSSSVVLDWVDTTDQNGCSGITYDVYVEENDTTPDTIPNNGSNLASSTYTFSANRQCGVATTYYWQIVAKDTVGNTITSAIWRFDTAPLGSDFSIWANPSSQTANPQDSYKVYNVYVNPQCGYSSPVNIKTTNVSSVNPASRSGLGGKFSMDGVSFNLDEITLSPPYPAGYVGLQDTNTDDLRGTTFTVTLTGNSVRSTSISLYINKRPNASFVTTASSPFPGAQNDPPSGVNPLTVTMQDSGSNGGGDFGPGNSILVFVADIDGNSTIDKCYYVDDFDLDGAECNGIWPGSGTTLGAPNNTTPDPRGTPWTNVYNENSTITYGVFDNLALVTNDAWKSFSFSDNIPIGELQPATKTVIINNTSPVAVAGISVDDVGSWFTSKFPNFISDNFQPQINVPLIDFVNVHLAAWKGTEFLPTDISRDQNGWSHATLGMENGGKCEWDTNFDSVLVVDTTNTTLPIPQSCSAESGVNYLTRNISFTSPGVNPFSVLLLTDKASSVSNVASVNVNVKPYLKVNKAGGGDATITGSGINCGIGGTDCIDPYNNNDSVILSYSMDAGTTFTGWSVVDGNSNPTGECPGLSATCTVTMGTNKVVTGTFVKPTLRIAPQATILRVNQTMQFEVWYDPDGDGIGEFKVTKCNAAGPNPDYPSDSSKDCLGAVTWTTGTGNNTVLSVSQGLVRGQGRGVTTVTASYGTPAVDDTSDMIRIIQYKWEER